MNPRPIAFGITDLDVGGAERTLVELVRRLDRNRWSPSVVCLQPCTPPRGRFAADLTAVGVPVLSLEVNRAGDLPRSLVGWTRELRNRRPVLLQTFLFHANLLGRLAALAAGVSHVVTGVRVAERRQGAARWRGVVDALLDPLTDCHVCVSEAVRSFTHRTTGVPCRRLPVIGNGVDTARADAATAVDRALLGATAAQTALVVLGRLDPQKGVATLLAALAELARRRPTARDDVRVTFVGDGPLRASLAAAAETAGVGPMVRDVGWRAEPFAWLKAADGLVLASHWEGMPNAVLEAMAAGKPVVATDVEGVRELVDPDKTGWLAAPRDPHSLADALERFLDAR
ncbi:MAG: glycosyltransferase, partial [Planctomycetia bacterium]